MGKARIARTLARAGLHLAATTVGRILKEDGGAPEGPTSKTPQAAETQNEAQGTRRIVAAKYPNNVWHVDLTVVPILGFWVPWLPLTLPQVWPFCWWVAVVEGHFSRRVMGFAVFRKPPTAVQITAFLTRTIRNAGAKPKYIICDKGVQFWCDGFKRWCKRRGIRPRFDAVGKHGSIAVVERFIRSLKQEGLRQTFVSTCKRTFQQDVASYTAWYNEYRPHTWLAGATPNEVYLGRRPANRLSRFEPRARWPRGSPCAKPQVLIKGKPGVRIELDVRFEGGRKHLPIITLRRVA
jgi:transposase InsO family protein